MFVEAPGKVRSRAVALYDWYLVRERQTEPLAAAAFRQDFAS